MKPLDLCKHDSCDQRAAFEAVLVLPDVRLHTGELRDLIGSSTVRVCEHHKRAARGFILNNENRTRLARKLVEDGWCSPVVAYASVKYDADVVFEALSS